MAPPDAKTVKRSIEGINRAFGGWKGLVDVEALKDSIRERRRTPSRRRAVW